MGLTELAQSSGFKNFTGKIYYWVRALIVLGIIFLINSWPGGAIIATVGGGLLIIIYFFIAFEPVSDEYDWTLAYPVLAGMSDPDNLDPKIKNETLEIIKVKRLRAKIETLNEEIENLS